MIIDKSGKEIQPHVSEQIAQLLSNRAELQTQKEKVEAKIKDCNDSALKLFTRYELTTVSNPDRPELGTLSHVSFTKASFSSKKYKMELSKNVDFEILDKAQEAATTHSEQSYIKYGAGAYEETPTYE